MFAAGVPGPFASLPRTKAAGASREASEITANKHPSVRSPTRFTITPEPDVGRTVHSWQCKILDDVRQARVPLLGVHVLRADLGLKTLKASTAYSKLSGLGSYPGCAVTDSYLHCSSHYSIRKRFRNARRPTCPTTNGKVKAVTTPSIHACMHARTHAPALEKDRVGPPTVRTHIVCPWKAEACTHTARQRQAAEAKQRL
jgi:hypothetical protein